VDNTVETNVWKISRQFLSYYGPICLGYLFLFVILSTSPGTGFTWLVSIIFLICLTILFLIMYLFIILPVIFFKLNKSSAKLMAMLLFALFFTAFFIFIYIKALKTDNPLNPNLGLPIIFSISYSILSFGVLISLLYFIEEKQLIAKKRIVTEQNIKLKNDKLITETHLKLLQAQIEPHFLFNTLTSIYSLTDTDLPKAKMMHNNLMQYLKTTLSKTRAMDTTIDQEVDLIKAYLDIFKIRMGKRLQYSIKADIEVSDLHFPSMLIQPIVENAIKHGLEPKIGGGEIRIQVKKVEDNKIRWIIEDTGLGMSELSNLGTGLSNIMERLELLYGKNGSLDIKENHPSGVKVILEVPYV
jgi:sensor histidine kinase YesM